MEEIVKGLLAIGIFFLICVFADPNGLRDMDDKEREERFKKWR